MSILCRRGEKFNTSIPTLSCKWKHCLNVAYNSKYIHFIRSLGRSTLSSSGRRLAVVNPRKGVDWFSFSYGRYLLTSGYSTHVDVSADNRFNQLAFVDEDTVIVTHKSGSLLFVSFGMAVGPSHVTDLGVICKFQTSLCKVPGVTNLLPFKLSRRL